MMIAVYSKMIFPKQGKERRGLYDGNLMGNPVVRGCHVMQAFGWSLQVQILIEASTQEGVQELQSPADSKHGHSPFQCFAKKELFHLVAFPGRFPAFLHPFFPVEFGVDILSAGQEDSIAQFCCLDDFSLISTQGHDQGHSSRRTYAVQISRQHPQAFPANIHQWDNANHRFSHRSHAFLFMDEQFLIVL